MIAAAWHCSLAWLGDEPVRDVLVEAGGDGRITSVTPGVAASPERRSLMESCCLVLRTLTRMRSIGRCEVALMTPAGSFWTWRERMYALQPCWIPTRCSGWRGRCMPRWCCQG